MERFMSNSHDYVHSTCFQCTFALNHFSDFLWSSRFGADYATVVRFNESEVDQSYIHEDTFYYRYEFDINTNTISVSNWKSYRVSVSTLTLANSRSALSSVCAWDRITLEQTNSCTFAHGHTVKGPIIQLASRKLALSSQRISTRRVHIGSNAC